MTTKYAAKNVVRTALQLSDFVNELCNPAQLGGKPSKLFEGLTNSNNATTDGPMALKQSFEKYKSEQRSAESYWNSLDMPKEAGLLPQKFTRQFGKDVEMMGSGQLVQLLQIMASNRVPHERLVKLVCDRINKNMPDNVFYLIQTINNLSKLNHAEPVLITKLKCQFLSCLKTGAPLHMNQFACALRAFAKLHLSEQRFWRESIQWLEPKLAYAGTKWSKEELAACLGAFTSVNVDFRLAQQLSGIVTSRASRTRSEVTPRDWLSHVYMFAMFKTLTPSLAESVLNSNYLSALEAEQKERKQAVHAIFYNNIRLASISAAAHMELEGYRGPLFKPKGDGKEAVRALRELKYRTTEEEAPLKQPALILFGLMFRLVAPLKSHSTGPEWHAPTGALLEGRCFVDTRSGQLVPLREARGEDGNGNKLEQYKEVAVLFFLENHLTRVFDPKEDVGRARLLGIYQMNVRHLKAAGLHPVVFTEQQFAERGTDERAKVQFIREHILHLAEDFHDNEWPEMEEKLGIGLDEE